jgi:SAM-dependent methyltransferase
VEIDEFRRMAAAGERHWWYRNTRLLLRQLLEPVIDRGPDALHLDAGGGTGATGGWLTESATTVLGDHELMALEVARSDFAGYRPVRLDLNELPFADGSISTVLCVTVLYHRLIADPAAAVHELARVTRPGGIVCLWEPGVRRLIRGHDRVTHTARRFSVGDMRRLAEGAGLEVVRATGAYAFLVPPAAALAVVERGKETSDVGRNETGLGGVLSGMARAERALLRHVDLPAGLSAIVVARKPG